MGIPYLPTSLGSPLSPRQKASWKREQTEDTRATCIVPALFRLQGSVNRPALKQSLDDIVRRHEVLRTVYHGEPFESVLKPGYSVFVSMFDLRSHPENEREFLAQQIAREESSRPFDLTRDQMLRASLLQLRDHEHLLLLTAHDIAYDGVSAELTLRELAILYNARITGRHLSLPDLPIQYSDLATLLIDSEETKDRDQHLAYWKRHLADSPNVIPLSTDRPRPPRRTSRGARERLLLSSSLIERLTSFGEDQQSLRAVLLGAFQTLLHRYTGSEDLVVAIPVSFRTLEAEHLIGPFTNLIALRTDFSGDPTFRELIEQIHDDLREASRHKDVTLEEIADALAVRTEGGCSPFSQIQFDFRDEPSEIPEFLDLKVESLDFGVGISTFDLSLEITRQPGGLCCNLKYDTHLFDPSTIQRMLGHYQMLLDGAVGNPDTPVSRLPILTEAERYLTLVEWNKTDAEFPQTCVHQLFEDQVRRTPDAVALVYESQQLTYAELNARANRLANRLATLGVGPDVMVAICIERSTELVVGLLAVLKAGGAYVPLDPSYPQERLAFQLADLPAPILLCRKVLGERLAQHASSVLPVEEWADSTSGESPENPTTSVRPDHLAYVLYTSGSTGRPKGALISHRALVNYLTWCAIGYPAHQGSGSPVHTPIGFDLTITSLFPPLLAGRSVVLIREDPTLETLADALRLGDFGLVKLTPSHLEALNHKPSLDPSKILTRMFVIGGEALKAETVADWRKHAPTIRIVNEYGPTEATVGCCVYEVPVDAVPVSAIPIGRPIPNVRLYVLDRHLQPVPIGVPGQLHIAGVGLARGYHRRPELTSEKFILDPFDDDPEARLYKTGDLVRYRSDGNLEFLGRFDDQVKIRGIRIELSEIEAAITECEGIRETVVTAQNCAAGNLRLVAYIVANESTTLQEDQIRMLLKRKLPEYMLPARFVVLPLFPLTRNGKTDRQALRTIDPAPETRQAPSIAPCDALEYRLLKIWEEVLSISPIGMDDDFFDLGGDSLQSIILLAKIEDALNQKLPLGVLYEAPTIARLAARLGDPDSLLAPLVLAIQPSGSRPPFLCVGAFALFRPLAHKLGFDQPFLGVPLPGARELMVPYRLEDIAAHCVKTIRATQAEGPYFLGGWCDTGVLAYEIAQQLRRQGQHVALLVLFDAKNPSSNKNLSRKDAAFAGVFLICQWLKQQYRTLRHLRGREVVQYIRGLIAWRIYSMKQRIWTIVYRSELRAGAAASGQPLEVAQVLPLCVQNYDPQPYDGPTLLFQRKDRPTGRYRDSQYGWGKVANKLQICEVPGDHMTMFSDPNVQVMGERLDSSLRETSGSGIAQTVARGTWAGSAL
jgi:amino acid adenylation domain-containing protein